MKMNWFALGVFALIVIIISIIVLTFYQDEQAVIYGKVKSFEIMPTSFLKQSRAKVLLESGDEVVVTSVCVDKLATGKIIMKHPEGNFYVKG